MRLRGFTELRIPTKFSKLEELSPTLKVVTIVRLQMILMVTLCKSGTMKSSVTSPAGPNPKHLSHCVLGDQLVGKLSEVASININKNTFLFEPSKQISQLCPRGHTLSLPTMLPFIQMLFELLSLRKTPVLFLTMLQWHLDTTFSHLLPTCQTPL